MTKQKSEKKSEKGRFGKKKILEFFFGNNVRENFFLGEIFFSKKKFKKIVRKKF